MGKKAIFDLTPEQRAAEAERARMLKSPRRAAEQERLRLLGQKLGLNQIAERLRNAETSAPSPQQPTPQQRKRGSAGRKRSIPAEQIEEGIHILRRQPRMSTEAARATLRAAGIKGEDGPLYRLIIQPAYAGMSK
jgi:hypothetical protein